MLNVHIHKQQPHSSQTLSMNVSLARTHHFLLRVQVKNNNCLEAKQKITKQKNRLQEL